MGVTKRRGFTLVEVLLSSLLLGMVSAGVAGAYVMQSGMLARTTHRLQAVNFARSAAEDILETRRHWYLTGMVPSQAAIGRHDQASDPGICGLPECYFRDVLGGKIYYDVRSEKVNKSDCYRIDVMAEWKEVNGVKPEREAITFFTMFSKI